MDNNRALSHTRELLQQKLSQDPNAPHLIIKPRFVLSIANETYEVEPDALIVEGSFYRTIEIKSYADRGGKTDPAAIRGACRQLAVSVIALQEAIAQLGVAQPTKMVPAVGDLILRAPGSMKPTRREMLLRGEVSSIRSYLRELPQMLSALPSASLDTSGALDALPNNYRSTCREFCAMAHRCKQQALSCGVLSAFGDNASESLAAAQNLGRVIELLQPGTAKTPEEEALSKQLQEAARALTKCVSL